MIGDRVAFLGDASCERRRCRRHAPHHEEGRAHALRLQRVEKLAGGCRKRTVIEGEHHLMVGKRERARIGLEPDFEAALACRPARPARCRARFPRKPPQRCTPPRTGPRQRGRPRSRKRSRKGERMKACAQRAAPRKPVRADALRTHRAVSTGMACERFIKAIAQIVQPRTSEVAPRRGFIRRNFSWPLICGEIWVWSHEVPNRALRRSVVPLVASGRSGRGGARAFARVLLAGRALPDIGPDAFELSDPRHRRLLLPRRDRLAAGARQRHHLRIHQGDRGRRRRRPEVRSKLGRRACGRPPARRLSLLLLLPARRRADRLVRGPCAGRPRCAASGARHGVESAVEDLPRSTRRARRSSPT